MAVFKVALVQKAALPNNPQENQKGMVRWIEEAKVKGADLVLFPELWPMAMHRLFPRPLITPSTRFLRRSGSNGFPRRLLWRAPISTQPGKLLPGIRLGFVPPFWDNSRENIKTGQTSLTGRAVFFWTMPRCTPAIFPWKPS